MKAPPIFRRAGFFSRPRWGRVARFSLPHGGRVRVGAGFCKVAHTMHHTHLRRVIAQRQRSMGRRVEHHVFRSAIGHHLTKEIIRRHARQIGQGLPALC